MKTLAVGLTVPFVILATVVTSRGAPETAAAADQPKAPPATQVERDAHTGTPSSRLTYVYDANGNLERIVDRDGPFVYVRQRIR